MIWRAPLGVFSFSDSSEPDWSFYVVPLRQGKGLGTTLTRFALAFAGLKYRTIYAKVKKENNASLRLHRKLGFRLSKEFDNYLELFKDL